MNMVVAVTPLGMIEEGWMNGLDALAFMLRFRDEEGLQSFMWLMQ